MASAKEIKALSDGISVLYVEDDTQLRESTVLLLKKFFESVDAAKNGEEGLDLYRKNGYDLVISDINMPVMDGIAMSRAIKEQEPEQYILITSAHDESEHLIKLIDAGIDQFILKPLETEKFLGGIYRAVRSVSDKKMLAQFAELMERHAVELSEKNRELEQLNKLLTYKIVTTCAEEHHREEKPEEAGKKKGSEENYTEYVIASDIEELSDLEEEVDSAISLMVLSNRFDTGHIENITIKLEKMSSLLHGYPIFMELAVGIRDLTRGLGEIEAGNDQLFKKISIYLESFIFVLAKWKKDVLIEGVENPNMYDSSLLNDIRMMCDRIYGNESDGGEMELF